MSGDPVVTMKPAAAALLEHTADEVAKHNTEDDVWIIIHNEVFNVTEYLHDHPGGAEILSEIAGGDGSEAFDGAGHSDDAVDIKAGLCVGRLVTGSGSGAGETAHETKKKKAAGAVRLVAPAASSGSASPSRRPAANGLASSAGRVIIVVAVVAATAGAGLTMAQRLGGVALQPRKGPGAGLSLGFTEGVLLSSAAFVVGLGIAAQRFAASLRFSSMVRPYTAHLVLPRVPMPDPLGQRGWLDPGVFQRARLMRKQAVGPNAFRLVFELPRAKGAAVAPVLGLPTGQHVSVRGPAKPAATTGGGGDMVTVSRSYTPISNNTDRGVLELVVRCYEKGALTGGYLRGLQVGDQVEFRGPLGGVRYRAGSCHAIGMVAGGTGVTPMFQIVRAVCENPRDTASMTLVYASRCEADLLLRDELDALARRHPASLRVHYVLDEAPEGWEGGRGFVTREMLAKWMPAPSAQTKVFACGPPPMVASVKTSLRELGHEAVCF